MEILTHPALGQPRPSYISGQDSCISRQNTAMVRVRRQEVGARAHGGSAVKLGWIRRHCPRFTPVSSYGRTANGWARRATRATNSLTGSFVSGKIATELRRRGHVTFDHDALAVLQLARSVRSDTDGTLTRMSGQSNGSGYRERNATADRTLDLLSMFSEEQPTVSGALVATELGVSRSTAYRYLQSLVSAQFLEEAPSGGFRLGLRVMELARLARRTYGLSEIAAPVIDDLAHELGEAVLLTRRNGDLVVCLDRAESYRHHVRISYERGTVLPLNAGASAIVLFAWEDPETVRELLSGTQLRRFTESTLTDVDELLARLERIRSDGYAVSRSEFDPDVMGIAAPIWGHREGEVVAAVSVVGLISRIPAKVERRIIAKVRLAAAQISERYTIVQG
ncbi:IclR family transcriptional regulator [Saccharopolyspora sp. K220]|uniref:IclR family transcriptional regulator n=1 Tax=Saccharopolyspora soli TaxID=2926618 RepID=UPI001F583726|nr:IclR family transcriptional regulator [Saccharopolyspora soli]MCI2421428.1 IclR family transcriptional regulator [Saccharopolyspora soli]